MGSISQPFIFTSLKWVRWVQPLWCWPVGRSDRVTFPDHLSTATPGPARNLQNSFEQGEEFRRLYIKSAFTTYGPRINSVKKCPLGSTRRQISNTNWRPNLASRWKSSSAALKIDVRRSINLSKDTLPPRTQLSNRWSDRIKVAIHTFPLVGAQSH